MQIRPVVQLMMMGCLVGWLVMTPLWTLAKPTKDGRYRRTASPQFSVSKSSDTFFQDAFQEGLQGNRPATLNKTRTVSPDVATSPATHSDEGETNRYAWSTIISSTTIEDEIKNLRQAVDKTITTPGKYRDGGFRDGRIQFSLLAMLFAIIHDYDEVVRWQQYASLARDRFAKTGRTSKVGSLDAFRQASESKSDLNELVLGNGLPSSETTSPNDWEQICERPPLMGRLKIAQQDRLTPWTADPSSFRQYNEGILHEAELVAAIAVAMQQEGFDLADDEEYVQYCQQLQQSATSLAAAVRGNDPKAARKASSEIDQSCDACHSDYR